MKQKIQTFPNLIETSSKHKAAVAAGKDHFQAWQYNVADHFKGKSVEEIKQNLKETAHPFAVCFEHVIGDFNMGTGIRNANAFNTKEIFYVGDKKWDKRAAVGVYNYTEVQWIPTIEDFKRLANDYVIVGIDNVPGAVPLSKYSWKPNTLMVFGEEGTGLTSGMLELCEEVVEIEMYGSVRSLNCGVASGIVMNDFVTKLKDK